MGILSDLCKSITNALRARMQPLALSTFSCPPLYTAGWHHWLDGRESEWTPGNGDGQGGLACCDSWRWKESDRLSDWTKLITKSIKVNLENKETDQFLERLVSPMWSFLILFFSGWIPIWSVEAHHVYLLALASKTHARGSPRQGTLLYSSGRRWPT